MTQIDFYQLHNGRRCVRAVQAQAKGTQDFLDELQECTTATKADGMAVLAFLQQYLAQNLRDGNTVTLDGIGSFASSYRIKPASASKSTARLTAGDVEMKRLTFKAAPQLRREIAEDQQLRRVAKGDRQDGSTQPTPDERRDIALALAQQPPHRFQTEQYAQAAGISLSSAYRDLARFVHEGLITLHRLGSYKLYGPHDGA